MKSTLLNTATISLIVNGEAEGVSYKMEAAIHSLSEDLVLIGYRQHTIDATTSLNYVNMRL